jgi:hypothetical protein
MTAPSASDRSWFERHPAITTLALLAAIAGALDLAAGTIYGLVAGHSFYERPAARGMAEYDAQERRYRTGSAVYDHDLLPMASIDGIAWGGHRYDLRTNSLAFKDREAREVPLESDAHRILFLGDSFTEGVGYGYDQTFVGLIDSALAPRGIEVLNAGVSSYSPIIYWRKAVHWIGDRGLDVDEVVVYIDISDASNEAEVYSVAADGSIAHAEEWAEGPTGVRRFPSPGRLGWLKDFLKHHTVVLASLVHLKVAMEPPGAPNYPLDQHFSRWTIDDSTFEAYGREGTRRMVAHMDSLHRFLSNREIPLTVAVYPWPDQVMAGDLDSRQVRLWREWAAERDVRFINHFPAFVRGRTEEERMAILTSYYIDGDFHWNAAGHRLTAEGFLEAYRPPVDTAARR